MREVGNGEAATNFGFPSVVNIFFHVVELRCSGAQGYTPTP